jgi:hypothetical protein
MKSWVCFARVGEKVGEKLAPKCGIIYRRYKREGFKIPSFDTQTTADGGQPAGSSGRNCLELSALATRRAGEVSPRVYERNVRMPFSKQYHPNSRTIGEIAAYSLVCKAYQERASF